MSSTLEHWNVQLLPCIHCEHTGRKMIRGPVCILDLSTGPGISESSCESRCLSHLLMKRKVDLPDLGQLGLSEYESNLATLRDGLFTNKNEQARKALLYFMAASGITFTSLKASQDALRSFSSATWQNVCIAFNLKPTLGPEQLGLFDVPDLCLPPSVHKRMLVLAGRAMDVYQEPQHLEQGASRVRLFEAVGGSVLLPLSRSYHRNIAVVHATVPAIPRSHSR